VEAYVPKSIEMKRDMDLVRDLLFHIEADPLLDGRRWMSPATAEEVGVSDHSKEEVDYHLCLLIDAGLLNGKTSQGMPVFCKLTWEGHEFLDNIRDQDVWSRTKKRIEGLPSVALGVIVDIAKAEIRKRLGLS
jgi:hypothetical protein